MGLHHRHRERSPQSKILPSAGSACPEAGAGYDSSMFLIKNPVLSVTLPAALALPAALISQYGFGLHPCHLCILQRYPYAAIIVLGTVMLVLSRRYPAFVRPFLWLALLLYLTDAGIAAYHAGVEWGIFPGPASCTADTGSHKSIEEIRAEIFGAPLVSCGTPAFVFLGLSMAGWNVLYAVASGMLCWRLLRGKKYEGITHAG